MISKLNIQPTIRLLTLPTRIGSGPENSSNTNIWFQTHPLLARLRILCPSLGRFREIMADAVCKLCDWLFNEAMEEYGTQVIHTSRREVHRSLCISSPRLSIFVIFYFCLFFLLLLLPLQNSGVDQLTDSWMVTLLFYVSPRLSSCCEEGHGCTLICLQNTEKKGALQNVTSISWFINVRDLEGGDKGRLTGSACK